ncbi:MAG: hypothetical protein LC127_01885 [Chitinophagales bacterium]|nr:hypothetical protein [Chitinophagales bacterium]
MGSTSVLEAKNEGKSRVISLLIHLALLLLAFFYTIPPPMTEVEHEEPIYQVDLDMKEFRKIIPVSKPKPKPQSEPPLSAFDEESSNSRKMDADEGVLRPKSESAPNSAPSKDAPPNPEVVKPDVIDITRPKVITPPSPNIKVPGPKASPNDEVISSKTSYVPVKAPESSGTKSSPSSSSSTSSGSGLPGNSPTSGSTTGTSPNKPSTVDGTGTGKGKKGSGVGMSSGNDGDGGVGNSSDGTGMYDGKGDGIFGRKITYRDLSAAKAAINASGKVAVKVCINRAGLVTYAELLQRETTLTDRAGLKLYLKAARGYKFQPDMTAPKEQCGKLTFVVDNTINNKLR